MYNRQLCQVLNKKLIESLHTNSSLGLAHGKMGVCIYFFILSKNENNTEYKEIAEKLLEDISNNLTRDQSVDIESGLAGIALGIIYLIKNKYQSGDIDEILEDIDDAIYRKLIRLESSRDFKFSECQVIQLLYYSSIRYRDAKEGSDNSYFFKELIIRLINLLGYEEYVSLLNTPRSYSLYHYHLPLLLFVLNEVYCLELYNSKVNHILSSIVPLVLSHRPVLHSYRLYLLWGMLSISDKIQLEDWDTYINELKNQIDLSLILNNELKNQDIFISNGVACIYFLLYSIELGYNDYKLNYSVEQFQDRIKKSLAWSSLIEKDDFFKIHRGLFNGFTGSILLLLHLSKISCPETKD